MRSPFNQAVNASLAWSSPSLRIESTIRFGGNLGVEADQGIADKRFNEDFLGLSGAVLGRQVVPAKAKTTAFHFASPPLLAGAL